MLKKLVWTQFVRSPQVRMVSFSVVILLLIISILITVRAYDDPTEKEQSVIAAGYSLSGQFYSALYPDPDVLLEHVSKSGESSPVVFTKLIDSIDLTFSYEFVALGPVEGIQAEAELVAVVQNPGLWSREYVLAPRQPLGSDLRLSVPLDFTAIDQLISDTEKELGFAGHSDTVTLRARVHSTARNGASIIDDDFTHDLGVARRQGTLRWDDTLDGLERGQQGDSFYWKHGRFDYAIRLVPNSVYDSQTLHSEPTALQLPPQPLALTASAPSLPAGSADWVNGTFSYRLESDAPITSTSHEVSVTVTLQDQKRNWSQSLVLASMEADGQSFTVPYTIDFAYLNSLIEEVRKDVWLADLAPTVSLKSEVHTLASTATGPMDETFEQSISVTLDGKALQWSGNFEKSSKGSIRKTVTITNTSAQNKRLYSTIATSLLAIALLYLVVLSTQIERTHLSAAEEEARRARKKYKGIIIDVENVPGLNPDERVVSVASLEDLIGLSDSLFKPVVHKRPSAADARHEYYVFDGATCYRYLL